MADLGSSKAALRAEFPAWSIITTDRGRWWGIRLPLVNEQPDGRSCVEADTPEELQQGLREAEMSVPKAAGEVVFRLPADRTLFGQGAP